MENQDPSDDRHATNISQQPISEHNTLFHPIEQAKLIRTSGKHKTEHGDHYLNLTDSGLGYANSSIAQRIKSRLQAIEHQKQMLNIQRQRLINGKLKQRLQDVKKAIISEDVDQNVLESAEEFVPERPNTLGITETGAPRRQRVTRPHKTGTVDTSKIIGTSEPIHSNLPAIASPEQFQLVSSGIEIPVSPPREDEYRMSQTHTTAANAVVTTSATVSRPAADSRLFRDSKDIPESVPRSMVHAKSDISSEHAKILAKREELRAKYPNIYRLREQLDIPGISASPDSVSISGTETTEDDVNKVKRYQQHLLNQNRHLRASDGPRTDSSVNEIDKVKQYQQKLLEQQRWLRDRQEVIQKRQDKRLQETGTLGGKSRSDLSLRGPVPVNNGPDEPNQERKIHALQQNFVHGMHADSFHPLTAKPPDIDGHESVQKDLVQDQNSDTLNEISDQFRELRFAPSTYQLNLTPTAEGQIQSHLAPSFIPTLDIPSIAELDLSTESSGGEGDVESSSDELLSKNGFASTSKLYPDPSVSSAPEISLENIQDRVHHGYLSLEPIPKWPSKISEKPHFSPIPEVAEEDSFMGLKQERLLRRQVTTGKIFT